MKSLIYSRFYSPFKIVTWAIRCIKKGSVRNLQPNLIHGGVGVKRKRKLFIPQEHRLKVNLYWNMVNKQIKNEKNMNY